MQISRYKYYVVPGNVHRAKTGFCRDMNHTTSTVLTKIMQGGRRPGTFGNKRTVVLGDHPRHVLGTLESLERLGTTGTHKCTGYPQMNTVISRPYRTYNLQLCAAVRPCTVPYSDRTAYQLAY